MMEGKDKFTKEECTSILKDIFTIVMNCSY